MQLTSPSVLIEAYAVCSDSGLPPPLAVPKMPTPAGIVPPGLAGTVDDAVDVVIVEALFGSG